MPSRDDIQKQLEGMDGVSLFLSKREINELPNILQEGEGVKRLVSGVYKKGNGILVATDRRVLFVDKGMMSGLKVEDFPLSKISSVQFETGLLMGEITIFASGNKATITQIDKALARAFAEHIQATIADEAKTAPQSSGAIGIVEQLERLAALRDKGVLTDEEFQQQKVKLLNA